MQSRLGRKPHNSVRTESQLHSEVTESNIIYAVHREEADVDRITDDWELAKTTLMRC